MPAGSPPDPPTAPAGLRVGDLDGRRVGVWGAGREGAAALRALARDAPRADVVLVTSGPPDPDEPAPPAGPDGRPVARAHGADGIRALAACDVVIRSPGVPIRGAEADAVRAGGARITTGTALWLAERPDATVVGVTGTKGKSTTSALVAHLLAHAGVRVRLAGNIGRPLLDETTHAHDVDVWTLELSSYQLADLPNAPTVAAVTNLHRDHLPWHGGEEPYRRDKLRILTAGDGPRIAVLPHAQPDLADHATCPVTLADRPDGPHVAGAAIVEGDRVLARLDDLPLRGTANARNVVMALEVVRALGHDVGDLPGALADFRPLPHRQEVVAEGGGVRWVSDAIATTPEAALTALGVFAPGPVVLLAGGEARDQRYAPLVDAVVSGVVPALSAVPGTAPTTVEVAGVVGLPATGPAICDAVTRAALEAGRRVPTVAVGPGEPDAVMGAAVRAAWEMATAAGARPGGERAVTVLLSPAASTKVAFRDFVDCGDRFARAAEDVSGLTAGHPAAVAGRASDPAAPAGAPRAEPTGDRSPVADPTSPAAR